MFIDSINIIHFSFQSDVNNNLFNEIENNYNKFFEYHFLNLHNWYLNHTKNIIIKGSNF